MSKPAQVSPTSNDLSWLAGFLEGEGHFGTAAKCEQVAASQVNDEPLARVLRLLGGSMTYHVATRKNENDIFRWAVTGSRARGVMLTLFPLLSEKRQEQIRAAFAVRPTLKHVKHLKSESCGKP